MDPVLITRGDSPLVLSFPHTGTYVPDNIRARLNDEGQCLRDTDWHIEKLYAGLLPNVTMVQATFHRYVIDANRNPSGKSLYPGQTTTGLVPQTNFDNVPIWRDGEAPDEAEIIHRTEEFHAPYHAALNAELIRVKAIHGYTVLYDCHSIRSVIPWLFEGILPDFNIGTDGGRSCDPLIEAAVHAGTKATGRTEILNGRFRGGWTTRHYGQPSLGIHAIQMELAQATHLATEEPPFTLSDEKCAVLRPQLTHILTRLLHSAAKTAGHAAQH